MAFHDNPRVWSPRNQAERQFALTEDVKESWRRQADRLLNEVGPSCGLEIAARE